MSYATRRNAARHIHSAAALRERNTPKWARTTNLRLRRPLLYPVELPVHKTKGEGFEPSMRNNPHTRLAGERLQPLGHPFKTFQIVIQSRKPSVVSRNVRPFTRLSIFMQVFFSKKFIFIISLSWGVAGRNCLRIPRTGGSVVLCGGF